MSAASSPGRTWLTFGVERRMPFLAGALAAAIFYSGDYVTRLSGMADR